MDSLAHKHGGSLKIPVYDKSIKWSVVFKTIVEHEGQAVAGLCDFTTRTVYITTSYPKGMSKKHIKDQISRSYWHEYFHAVFYECDIRDQSWWSGDNEHAVIAPLAKAMALIAPVDIDLD